MILVALVACHGPRGRLLEERVGHLRNDVRDLDAEVAELTKILDGRPPPTASIRLDRDPNGFDAERALPPGDPARPDVVLLSIDTLRADHLGAYGYARPTSPFLDALAEEGTLFEQAWSPAPWTLPSHTTILSGQLPVHHGVIEDHLRIPADVPMVQEAFRAAGYRTVGVVATLFVSSRFGFERGFDTFQDFEITSKQENNQSTVDADQVFHHALHWAQGQPAGQPLFLFLHVYDPHYQYDPPAPWNTKFDRPPQWGDEPYKNYQVYKNRMISRQQLDHQVAQYDEEIAFVDDAFRDLVERWRQNGRELLVVVTADHGEEFGERGSWGHAHTLWPEQLHVPLIVNGPGVRAQRVAERVGSEDIAETVADLAGVPFPTPDGRSRAAQIRSGTRSPGDPTPAAHAETSRFDTLVYRWHADGWDLHADIARGVRAMCDVIADPKCEVNAYKAEKERAERMFAQMSAWLGQPWRVVAAGKVEVTGGMIFKDGQRTADLLPVRAGDRFAIEPGDAIVRFLPADGGPARGPWRPLGGTIPGRGCPLAYDGRFTIDNELPAYTADQVEMLRSLGYITADEEGADAGPSGPEACN